MIQGINLIPDEIRRRKRTGQKRPLIISLLIVYVLVLGMVYFYQKSGLNSRLGRVERMIRERDELATNNAKYKEVIERVNTMQKKEADIKKRLEVIDALLKSRIYWSEILKSMTQIIPEGVWLMSLSTYDLQKGAGKGVRFNGTAFSNSKIAEFIFAMENSRYFGNVILDYSQKRTFQDRDLYDFEVTADLKK